MIENSPFTINIARLGERNHESQAFLSDIEQYTFSEDRGFGFSIESTTDNGFSAYLIERKPIILKEFDMKSNSVVEKNNYQTNLIPFLVDLSQDILLVFSNQNNLTKVTSRIGEAVQWSFSIDNVTLDLSKLYMTLCKQELIRDLSSIRIRNFQTDSGLSGTFTVKNDSSSNSFDFINDYNGDITVIRGDLMMRSEKAKVAFYRSGTVRLYNRISKENEFWDAIQDAVNSAIV